MTKTEVDRFRAVPIARVTELERVARHRDAIAAAGESFLIDVTESAREFLLMAGTDFRYGARHLKRAIERLLVQPLSNLIASGQIHWGDSIRVSHQDGSDALMFGREPEAVQAWGAVGLAA
jgi:ATP-dependent Clp protease ATP-binding subunit ClpA